jgi:hypothetical protein
MVSDKTKVIYDVINPIHSFSRTIGLTSFSIKRDKHKNYKGFVSFNDVLCFMISSLFAVFILVRNFSTSEIYQLNHAFLTTHFEKCSVVVACFQIIILLATNLRFVLIKDKLVNVIRMIADVDEVLMNMNCPVDHAKHLKFTKLFLILMCFLNMFGAFVSFVIGEVTGAYQTSFLMLFGELISTQTLMLLCTQFIFFMWSIKKRNFHVNQILRKNFDLFHEINRKSHVTKSDVVARLAVLQEKIVRISEDISWCYGTPVRCKNLHFCHILINV